ncbi:MAG: DUF2066 domain-containing protein [Pseudomonadota bacterium]
MGQKAFTLVLSMILFGFGALLSSPAPAATVSDLYTAEVPYDSARRNGREMAYETALRTVLSRITPDARLVDTEAVLGKTSQYVSGWREGAGETLWVSLDGVTITARLRAAGIPVWGSDRPLTLVWLALDRGRDGRELVGAQAAAPDPAESSEPLVLAPVVDPTEALRAALKDSATRYGLPLMFPRLDETDLAAVTPSDVWGGFDDVVLEASQRYRTSSVLMGRGNASNPESIRWTWLFSGDEREISGSIDRAARQIASVQMQALASNPDASSSVRVLVVGLQGASGYARLLRYVETESLIERADVVAMRGDSVVLEIDSLTTRERLQRILSGAGLEPVQMGMTFGGDPLPGADPFSNADIEMRVVFDEAFK